MNKEIIVDPEGLEKLIDQKLEQREEKVKTHIQKIEDILHEVDADDKIPDEAEGTVALIVYMFFKTLVNQKELAIKDKDETISTLKKVSYALVIAVVVAAIRQMFNIDIDIAEMIALLGG